MISLFYCQNNKYHKFSWTKIRQKRGVLVIYLKLFAIAFLVVFVFFVQSNCNVNHFKSELIAKMFHHKSNQKQYEDEIKSDLAKQIPGLCDFGVKCLLSGEDKASGELSYAAQAINVVLSDFLSYNRTPPDIQNSLCKAKKFDLKKLPRASVIIIFYNEPYSVLLRTIHSVLNTAKPENLEEIIVVDDASTVKDLSGKLEYYIKTRLPGKVKLLRLPTQ